MDDLTENQNVENIKSMFPNIPEDIIRRNLQKSKSVEATINGILDGTVTLKNNQTRTDHNDSSDDLPDLSQSKGKQLSLRMKRKNAQRSDFYSDSSDVDDKCDGSNFTNFDSIKTVHDIDEDSDDLPDYNLSQKDTKKTSLHMKTKNGSQRQDFYSDSSDIENTCDNSKPTKTNSPVCETENVCPIELSSDTESNCTIISYNQPVSPETALKESMLETYDHFANVVMEEEGPQDCQTLSKEQNITLCAVLPTEEERSLQSDNLAPKINPVSTNKKMLNNKSSVNEKAKSKITKEKEKERKKLERENKLRIKEAEASRKRALREARKNAQPKECIKFITVCPDQGLVKYPFLAGLLTAIHENEMKVELCNQPRPNIITFWRETSQIIELPNGKVTTEPKEIIENDILLYLPFDMFSDLVEAQLMIKEGQIEADVMSTLRSYVGAVKASLENRPVTLIVQGRDKYFKALKMKKGKKSSQTKVTLDNIEEALVDLQLYTGSNVQFAETEAEVVKIITQYAKAIAVAPFKQDQYQAHGFSFHIDGSGSVRIDRDGTGLMKVWRQQIQQFKGISAEVANAIIAAYPSPKLLMKAYESCTSQNQAESLLQDLVVRRGYGVMETSRRVGKEMSRRMFFLFTSRDYDLVIK